MFFRLTALRKLGTELGLDMWVYGPETHMTSICAMALGLVQPPTVNLAQPRFGFGESVSQSTTTTELCLFFFT